MVLVVGLISVLALVLGIVDFVRVRAATVAIPGLANSTNAPTVRPEQPASAKKELCSAYEVAARSVTADTNSGDRALARISLVNAAGMLDAAAANPALSVDYREAARTLASAYRTSNAVSSVTDGKSPLYQSTLDDAARAAKAMAAICR